MTYRVSNITSLKLVHSYYLRYIYLVVCPGAVRGAVCVVAVRDGHVRRVWRGVGCVVENSKSALSFSHGHMFVVHGQTMPEMHTIAGFTYSPICNT